MTIKTFTVTQADIDKGQRSDSRACPIARAIKREYSPATYVTVSSTRANIGNRSFLLPDLACQFVAEFDTWGRTTFIMPFAFQLNIPDTEPVK